MQDTQLAPRAHSDIRCLHFLCYGFSFLFFSSSFFYYLAVFFLSPLHFISLRCLEYKGIMGR
ncbi:hypothetical protein CGRA01v4_08945 [Colletotrichum graminicola]|nr:hypothetical protein CGRA01v4_08945 [Colletotrichum graminicola]